MTGIVAPLDESALLAKWLGRSAQHVRGYAMRQLPGIELVALESVAHELVTVLRMHKTLYDWARGQAQPQALKGRAPVYVATVAGENPCTVVVRHSWHGGLLAPLTGDRYRRPTRAGIELCNSAMLRARAIPTPEVVAFALYEAGPGFARVDVATRYIPNARDFGAVLAGLAPGIGRTEAYNAVQVLLQQLAIHGFLHPDLNIKNILLYKQDAALVAAVLDVDVMRWRSGSSPSQVMAANTRRLARSMSKAERQHAVEFRGNEQSEFMARANSMLLGPPAAEPRASRAFHA